MVNIGRASRVSRLEFLTWRLLGCEPAFAGWLLGIQLWLALLWFFYQGFGVVRGVILCGLLIGLIVLRFPFRFRAARPNTGSTVLPDTLRALLVATVLLDIGLMIVSCATSFERSKIPMDEGQTSWRAARLLWRGENPYGTGALVDFGAYRSRAPERSVSGIENPAAGPTQHAEVARYDVTLDTRIRKNLLPVPANETAAAMREARLYGYKYGPVILLLTALVTPLGVPAAVLLLNGLACFALYGTSWRILSRIASPQLALAGVAMLALLLDRHITRNYIDRSATDVWALLFGSLAVLAVLTRRPFSCAAAVAVAIGCKSIPGLLFVPLLLRFRSPLPVLVCGALSVVLYLPWLIWDSAGVVYNVFLWPFYMATDFTSWQYFVPTWMTLAARIVVFCALAFLWSRYILGREPRLFWTLAVSSTLVLISGGFLRNGYVPWASLWAVAAVVEAFVARNRYSLPKESFLRAETLPRHAEPANALALARNAF